MFLSGYFQIPEVYMFCNESTFKTHALQEASHTAQALHIADDKHTAFVKCHFNVTKSKCACTTDMARTSCPYSNRARKITR